MGKLKFQAVSIYQAPNLALNPLKEERKGIVIKGDAHAHPLLIGWPLMAVEAIHLQEGYYNTLIALYREIRRNDNAEMSKETCENILKFIWIIHTHASINSAMDYISLDLGDTQDDRNGPDTLIEAWFYRFRKFTFETWSNHNHDAFLRDHQQPAFGGEQVEQDEWPAYLSYRRHQDFLAAMKEYYPNAKAEEIFKHCATVNKKRYRLIAYVVDNKNCLQVAYHAPVPVDRLRVILGVWYQYEGAARDKEPENLRELIDWANHKFAQMLSQHEEGNPTDLHGAALFQLNQTCSKIVYRGREYCHPIYLLIWYRESHSALSDYELLYQAFCDETHELRSDPDFAWLAKPMLQGAARLMAHGHDGQAQDDGGPNLNSYAAQDHHNCIRNRGNLFVWFEKVSESNQHNLKIAEIEEPENQLDLLFRRLPELRQEFEADPYSNRVHNNRTVTSNDRGWLSPLDEQNRAECVDIVLGDEAFKPEDQINNVFIPFPSTLFFSSDTFNSSFASARNNCLMFK